MTNIAYSIGAAAITAALSIGMLNGEHPTRSLDATVSAASQAKESASNGIDSLVLVFSQGNQGIHSHRGLHSYLYQDQKHQLPTPLANLPSNYTLISPAYGQTHQTGSSQRSLNPPAAYLQREKLVRNRNDHNPHSQ